MKLGKLRRIAKERTAHGGLPTTANMQRRFDALAARNKNVMSEVEDLPLEVAQVLKSAAATPESEPKVGKAEAKWHDIIKEAQEKFCVDALKALCAKMDLKGGRIEKGAFGSAKVTLSPGSDASIFFKGNGSVGIVLTGVRALDIETSPVNHTPTSLAVYIVNKTLAKYMSE